MAKKVSKAKQRKPPIAPMEALLTDEIPSGSGWQYEPKWDGFRCLAFRAGDEVYLQSKSGQPLARYFPDVVRELLTLKANNFILDGEIVIPIRGRLDFDSLLARIHPASSRVTMLAEKHPAVFVVFDLLGTQNSPSCMDEPLEKRRARLELFAKENLGKGAAIHLSPVTTQLTKAKSWFKAGGGDLDGVMAKRLDLEYRSGTRDGMVKVKQRRTADCVVGGFRYAEGSKLVGSLLLGVFNEANLLDHVGFASSFSAAERKKVTEIVKAAIGPPGFTGNAPDGPSRWSTKKSSEWTALKTKLVVEVEYDHFTGSRFRHGTKLLRWRSDKAPQQCTLEQFPRSAAALWKLLKRPAARKKKKAVRA